MRWLLLGALAIGCTASKAAPDGAMGFNTCSWRDPQFGPSQCFNNADGGGFWCTCCSCTCVQAGSGLWWQCEPDEPFTPPCPILPPM